MQAFDFGSNWEFFSRRYLDEARLEKAKESLIAFCGEDSIRGKSFLDVGAGSGLFSLAAYRLGAAQILSFDVNPRSIYCCQRLWEKEGCPPRWTILKGSVLDSGFLPALGTFDLVYAWGVLHHTGDMWRALTNTAGLVTKGGRLYLALYNRAEGFRFYPDARFGPSSFWLVEKKLYSSLPGWLQTVVDYGVMGLLIFLYAVTLRNPAAKIRGHNQLRGMSWRVDIKDWLGGYPYEYASVEEVVEFVQKLGLSLKNLKSNDGLLNNEYLFEKNA